MNHEAIRDQLPSLISAHIPRNSRAFKYRIFDDQPQKSTLGFVIDPAPFQGTVVAMTDEAIILKTARTKFAVLDRQLVTTVPEVGASVEVTPYARRRFDGQRIDTPVEEKRRAADGTYYTTSTVILGGNPVKLPVPEPRCPELACLIEQLENLPAPDGFRGISHLLVDAGARDFELVDPAPSEIVSRPPAIRFSVDNPKCRGCVAILYKAGVDLYAITVHQDDRLVEVIDDIYFDTLGAALERLLDDGSWRRIRIDVLPTKARRHTRH